MIEKYIQALKEYALSHEPSCTDGESILGMLYEWHNENCPYDNDEIKGDFNELYQQMNGMSLRVRTPLREITSTGEIEHLFRLD